MYTTLTEGTIIHLQKLVIQLHMSLAHFTQNFCNKIFSSILTSIQNQHEYLLNKTFTHTFN